MSKVWVAIFADIVRDRMVNAAMRGNFALANTMNNSIQGLLDEMKSLIQSHGGSMPFGCPDIIVMELPVNVAADLPNIINGFCQEVNGSLAVGIGLDYQEAAAAAMTSYDSGKIEMFSPNGLSQENIQKSNESRRILNPDVSLPANLFDPQQPDDEAYQEVIDEKSVKVPKRMSLQESLAAEGQYLQAINDMLGIKQIQEAQQQAAQQQATQQQAAQQQAMPQQPQGNENDDHSSVNTADLLGQLSGVPSKAATQENTGSDEQQQNATQEITQEVSEATEEAQQSHKEDLMQKLQAVKEQIPQIMALADKNPEAFKQTMATVQKLIASARQVQKSEQLEKATVHSGPEAMSGIRFPVGTRKGKYKKIVVNGKQVWRSMGSGAVLDDDGTEISVKEKNAQQKAKQQ